jgi:hypothetical protein
VCKQTLSRLPLIPLPNQSAGTRLYFSMAFPGRAGSSFSPTLFHQARWLFQQQQPTRNGLKLASTVALASRRLRKLLADSGRQQRSPGTPSKHCGRQKQRSSKGKVPQARPTSFRTPKGQNKSTFNAAGGITFAKGPATSIVVNKCHPHSDYYQRGVRPGDEVATVGTVSSTDRRWNQTQLLQYLNQDQGLAFAVALSATTTTR